MKRDQKNNIDLSALGWKVLRYPSQYVVNHTDECVTEIIQEIAYLKNN